MTRSANDDMVEGYMDGRKLTTPVPLNNRSASYRHGFMVGHGEKTNSLVGDFRSLSMAADKAMDEDERRMVQ